MIQQDSISPESHWQHSSQQSSCFITADVIAGPFLCGVDCVAGSDAISNGSLDELAGCVVEQDFRGEAGISDLSDCICIY
jgi:hypothetical protein